MASTAQPRNLISTIDWSVTGRTEFWFEVMWLGALALVPLLFGYNNSLVTFGEAKSYALHFFALLTLVLLITDAANQILAARARGEKFESFDVLEWLRASRANLLIAAVAAFIFVYVISTALSQMPFFSFWGVTPASDGYNLYSFLSLMVIFFAVITYIREVAQIWRILYLVAIVGTITSIYGISQHFGWDPIGIADTSDRVISTFGNPIFFGAYLVMSIPITAVLILDSRITSRKRAIALVAIAIGLQVSAMWFTGSRGPLVGLVAGMAMAIGATALLLNRRHLVLVSSVIGIGAVLAVVVAVLPGGAGSARAVEFGGELSGLASSDGSGVVQGGLAGRAAIWSDVLELSVTWQTFQEDEGLARLLRPLFGFGPDMLRFSSPLVSSPRSTLEVADHAHNRALQVLAEEGWVGFVVFLTIIGLLAWLVWSIARSARSERSTADKKVTIVFVAVIAGLAGASVEQLVGVGRASDLLTSWVLVGLVVVIYRHVAETKTLEFAGSAPDVSPADTMQRQSDKRTSAQSVGPVSFFIGVVALIGALATFALVDGQILRASRLAIDLQRGGDATEVFTRLIDARSYAPQVEHFTLIPVGLLFDDTTELLELGQEDPEKLLDAADLGAEAFRLLLEYHEKNPLAIRTRLLMAETAALLVEVGVADFRDEMVIRYEELARQFPNETRVLAVVANAYAAADLFDESIAMAERAISLEPKAGPIAQAWWIRGIVLDRLGRVDEAITSLQTAVVREPNSEFAVLSHLELVRIYTRMGETELAEQHEVLANELRERLDAE